MNKSQKLAGGAFITVIVILVIWVILPKVQMFWRQDSCLDSGGKWVEEGNYCVMAK